MIQVYFTGLHCDEETDEVGSDEPYVLVTTVDLASLINVGGFPVPVPAFDVFRYGPYGDVGKGNFRTGPGIGQSFWSLTGAPGKLDDPDKAIFVVALMENDDGDAENLRGIVKGLVGGSVLGSLSLNRDQKVAALIRDVNSGLGTPTGAPNFDDQIGVPQELRFTRDELARADSGAKIAKSLVLGGDGGRYTLSFEMQNAFPLKRQNNWRFCQKCRAMFWDGDANNKGRCTAGGSHEAQGFMFVLPFDGPETAQAQREWRFCDKCRVMFWNGDPNNKGRCAGGGAHNAQGLIFSLPHDTPAPGQRDWRFCQKCRAMFWDGDPNNKGRCPGGNAHEPQGFMFVLPFV